jgi:two-component system, cell cycle response regulator DivK
VIVGEDDPDPHQQTIRRDTLVLVVDDNAKNAKLARDVLDAAGLSTIDAGTGAEAIALALAHRPDVILMDIRLPGVDGSDAARRLKADPRTAHIPVVALTASAPTEQLLHAGFDGYLAKPIDIRSFPAQVRSYCA